MQQILIREVAFGSALYQEVVEVRRDLLRRPLGLDFAPEELAREVDDIHLAALDTGRVIGAVLLRRVDRRTTRLMRMAVVPAMQGKSVGRRLVEHSEALLRAAGFELVMMHARGTAVGFYEKCGYRTVGEAFLEQGIPHIRMEKPLL